MKLFNNDRKIAALEADNQRLRDLCEQKDSFFKELMADAFRHGSPLAAKHMADRKWYLKGK